MIQTGFPSNCNRDYNFLAKFANRSSVFETIRSYIVIEQSYLKYLFECKNNFFIQEEIIIIFNLQRIISLGTL